MTRLSVTTVLVQNFLFCTVIALILWQLVPPVGQYGFFNNFVHAQAIGNSICLLAIALSRLATKFEFGGSWSVLVSMLLMTPVGVYIGMTLASLLLGLPRGPLEFLQEKDQLIISVITAVVASIAFSWYLANREKLLRLELLASEERRRADNARHAMLQAQLEPHMLFNTLANLRALIATDSDRATEMLDRLDSFLRATLSSSQASSNTVEHEFAVLDDYLALMQIRLGKRLSYSLELSPDCSRHMIPTLILQPLVENAIRHGIEPQIDGGEISVSAKYSGEKLILVVADTGVGITVEQTEQTASPADSPGNTHAGGFGLNNLRERLSQSFSKDAQLKFESADTDPLITGTRITVQIPRSAVNALQPDSAPPQ